MSTQRVILPLCHSPVYCELFPPTAGRWKEQNGMHSVSADPSLRMISRHSTQVLLNPSCQNAMDAVSSTKLLLRKPTWSATKSSGRYQFRRRQLLNTWQQNTSRITLEALRKSKVMPCDLHLLRNVYRLGVS